MRVRHESWQKVVKLPVSNSSARTLQHYEVAASCGCVKLYEWGFKPGQGDPIYCRTHGATWAVWTPDDEQKWRWHCTTSNCRNGWLGRSTDQDVVHRNAYDHSVHRGHATNVVDPNGLTVRTYGNYAYS